MSDWKCVLELDEKRAVKRGDPRPLSNAIRSAADLRVRTLFRHNEHVDVTSDNAEGIEEAYDFDYYRFIVRDDWQEVLTHADDGSVRSGSLVALIDAFHRGCEIKIAVSGLCDDMADGTEPTPHEVFVHAGSCYHYTEQKLFITGSQPVVRVRPAIPLRYTTGGWDFGWLVIRTDGRVVYRRCDPYTLKFTDRAMQCALRWFVR